MKRRSFLKITTIFVFGLILLFSPLFGIFLKTENTNAAWYGFGWQYRQKFIINNQGSLTTDYQFLLDEAMHGRWKLDDNSGSTVIDTSGYSKNGTITGLNSGISWTASGKYSNALNFSGTNTSYIDIGDHSIYNNPNNNIALSAWLNTSSDTQMRVFSKGFNTSSYSSGYFLEIVNGEVRFGVGGGSLADSLYFSSTGANLDDNTWHNISAVLDGNNGLAYIYIDGETNALSKETNSCGTVDTDRIDISSCSNISLISDNNLFIGRNDEAEEFAFNGTLDELRFFNRVLIDSEINYLYINNVSPLLRSEIYSNTKDNGDDLRFATSNGSNDIPYHLEKFDGSDQYARIWLKIPSLAIGDNTIYIYYGNSSASSASSWQNTFLYGDDFAEGVGANWVISEDGNGSISQGGGDLDFSYSGTDTNWTDTLGREIDIISHQTTPNYEFWAQIKLNDYTVNEATQAGIAVYEDDENAYLFGRTNDTNDNFSLNKIGTASAIATNSSTELPSYLAIQKTTGGFSFWLSSDNIFWHKVGSDYSDISLVNVVLFGRSWDGNALAFSMDDFLIRKHLSNSPTIIFSDYQEVDTPILEFTIEGIDAEQMHNGVTTDIATSFGVINFGKLEMVSPKYAAHKITVISNSINGYSVTVKSDGYIQGLNPINKIDPFGADDVSWATPQIWSTPTGTSANSDSGWIGASTSDTRVTGWLNGYGKFGPLSSTAHNLMYSSTKDSGTSAYIVYAIEINENQPPDSYSGTITYNIVPTY